MFTPAERSGVRDALIAHARSDTGIAGAAIVGSAARDREDEWSDIDLVLQLSSTADEASVVSSWTAWMTEGFGVADTMDVFAAGGVRYRVFLLSSSLQVDVSFWPHDEFRATDEGFRLLFGSPAAATPPAEPDVDHLIGMGWLYALHARSALERGRLWQAALMLDELRNQLIALMCVRRGLNPWHGREVDLLPAESLGALAVARGRSVTREALAASKRDLLAAFLTEVALRDPSRAARLRNALDPLSD